MSEPTARPFTAASFNQALGEHKLMAARCPQCAALFVPPRALCPTCRRAGLEWVALTGGGKLAAFTVIYVGPSAMIAEGFTRDNPYVTGIVALDEGPQISARILGLDARNPDARWIGAPLTVAYLDSSDSAHGEGDQRKTLLAFRAA
jgi:uncharacterized OB-fold protein